MDDSKFGLFTLCEQPFLFGVCMDNELYLCEVEPDYLKFLHKIDSRVSVKYNNRPYIGIITMINNVKYVVPLTSQTTAKRKLEGKNKRAARITTFVKDSNEVEIANILHNNMIPVADKNFHLINIDAEIDTYEANEIRFIRKNKERIINKARKVHDDRILKRDYFLRKTCCDFEKLEQEYMNFNKKETC